MSGDMEDLYVMSADMGDLYVMSGDMGTCMSCLVTWGTVSHVW